MKYEYLEGRLSSVRRGGLGFEPLLKIDFSEQNYSRLTFRFTTVHSNMTQVRKYVFMGPPPAPAPELEAKRGGQDKF